MFVKSSSPISIFTSTEQGEVMNSFTQDLRLVDKDLPVALSSTSLCQLSYQTQHGDNAFSSLE